MATSARMETDLILVNRAGLPEESSTTDALRDALGEGFRSYAWKCRVLRTEAKTALGECYEVVQETYESWTTPRRR